MRPGAYSSLAPVAAVVLGMACYSMRGSSGGGQTSFRPPRPVRAEDVAVPRGYRIEAVATGLTYPTAVVFDDAGLVHVVEAGYSYGEAWTTPRLLRLEADGRRTAVASGGKNGPWTGAVFHGAAFYVAEGGQLEGGRILRITPAGSTTALVEGLPSLGDHHTNGPVAGPDGWIYFGQGTATNSAVVGEDNHAFGWLARHPEFHDVPCKDVTLAGANFESRNPLTPQEDDRALTGAFLPFGTPSRPGQVVPGRVPCNGAVMRVPASGGAVELVAWGFRNPFGLAFAPDGRLYVTDNGYDERGSRPAWGTGDLLWRVSPGGWYGWPDFWADHAVTVHKAPGKPAPKALLAPPPGKPPRPVATFEVHSSSDGLDFSRSPAFGHVGQAFVAQFGDMAPAAGKLLHPVGFKVLRVDVAGGLLHEFAVNRGKTNGPASRIGGGGLERPVAVRFSPDGTALYIVDFGVLTVSERGPQPRPETGVLWRVTREALAR